MSKSKLRSCAAGVLPCMPFTAKGIKTLFKSRWEFILSLGTVQIKAALQEKDFASRNLQYDSKEHHLMYHADGVPGLSCDRT